MAAHQYCICQDASGQFCNIITPFQLLTNLPSCITALYTKLAHSISARCSLQIRKTQSIIIPSKVVPNIWILTITSSCSNYSCHTHLPRRNIKIYYNKEADSHLVINPSLQCYIDQLSSTPHNENSALEVNISLDMANLSTIHTSSIDFHKWQHLEKHQNESQLQHLGSFPFSSRGSTVQTCGQ